MFPYWTFDVTLPDDQELLCNGSYDDAVLLATKHRRCQVHYRRDSHPDVSVDGSSFLADHRASQREVADARKYGLCWAEVAAVEIHGIGGVRVVNDLNRAATTLLKHQLANGPAPRALISGLWSSPTQVVPRRHIPASRSVHLAHLA